MSRLAMVAAALAAGWGLPVRAADPSTLGCVGRAIGPAVMRTLGEAALAMNDGEPFSPPEGELAGLGRAADACRRQHRWSDSAATAAAMWTLTSARLDAAAAALQRDGIAPMDAGAVVGRLSRAEREGLVRDQIAPFALNALKGYAIEAGFPTEGRPAHHFVWFTILLIKEEQQRMSFAAS
jgi:hypothetical protein